jgi:hypothetical protein
VSSDQQTRWKIHLGSGWDLNAEERWLARQAADGWLLKAGFLCVYSFRKAEPGSYTYRIDFRSIAQKELPEYVNLFTDAGWEHVQSASYYHVFRKESDGASPPEIYSDRESLRAMYRRLVLFHALFLACFAGLLAHDFFTSSATPPTRILETFWSLQLAVIGVGSYSLMRLLLMMTRLRKPADAIS